MYLYHKPQETFFEWILADFSLFFPLSYLKTNTLFTFSVPGENGWMGEVAATTVLGQM